MKTLEEISEIARSIAWSASDILQSYYRQDSNSPNLDIREQKDGPLLRLMSLSILTFSTNCSRL